MELTDVRDECPFCHTEGCIAHSRLHKSLENGGFLCWRCGRRMQGDEREQAKFLKIAQGKEFNTEDLLLENRQMIPALNPLAAKAVARMLTREAFFRRLDAETKTQSLLKAAGLGDCPLTEAMKFTISLPEGEIAKLAAEDFRKAVAWTRRNGTRRNAKEEI